MPSRREFIMGTASGGILTAATHRFILSRQTALGAQEAPSDAMCLNVRDFGARGDGTTDDSQAVQEAINRATRDGAVVYCPAGEYPIAIEIRNDVQVIGAPGTTFRAAGTRSVVRLTGDNASLWNVAVVGNRKEEPSKGLTAHCIEIRGSNARLENVHSGGGRYDSLYIRGGNGIVVGRCSFGPTARNTCSIVKGSDIWFEDCEFFQNKSISSSRFNGLYLYDIEPNGSDQVHSVTHIDCMFKTDLRDGYAGVILDAQGNRETGDNDISFYGCTFAKGASLAPAIRIHHGRVYKGLTLIDNTFDGMVLANDEPIFLSDSMLVGNEHSSKRFSYNVTIDDVLLVNHKGAGFEGLNSTERTVIFSR